MLFTGLANINLWYPWPFNFRTSHYWVAWITIGALVVHIGAKFTITRSALSRRRARRPTLDRSRRRASASPTGAASSRSSPGRRAMLTLVTVGQTVWPLRKLALLAPRRPDTGPQGFPVNRSAVAAGVVDTAQDPAYRLVVEGDVRTGCELSLDELRALPQHTATLPIACVEGWSASRTWRGVPVRDLLDLAGASTDARVRVHSLQERLVVRDVGPRPRPGAATATRCSRSRSRARRSTSTTGTRCASSGRTGPASCRPSGSRDWSCRERRLAEPPTEIPGRGFWIGLVLGTPVMVYGAVELVQQTGWPRAFDVARWFGGGILLHDLVLVPIVLARRVGRSAAGLRRRCTRRSAPRCSAARS